MSQSSDCLRNIEEERAAFVQDELGFFMNGFGHQKNCKATEMALLETLKVRCFSDEGENPELGGIR